MYSTNFLYTAPSSHQLESHDVDLVIRQEPKEALVTTEGKEKARKPVDPPPIVEIRVRTSVDPSQHFLQSPYLFMVCSLWKHDKDEPHDSEGARSLAGSLVSSLHRLKDVNNADGGFFVFGDISVKAQGAHRLRFSLFDLHKDTGEVMYLKAITSQPFKVLAQKDFKGLEESTYLSRAFSDQGVRLRLRKEPRAVMGAGSKRSFGYGGQGSQEPTVPTTPVSQAPGMAGVDPYSQDDASSGSPAKRYRSGGGESDEVSTTSQWPRSVQYPDPSTSNYLPNYTQSSILPNRPAPSYYGNFVPPHQQQHQTQYSNPGVYNYIPQVTRGADFTYRAPSITSSTYMDNYMPTSGAVQQPTRQYQQPLGLSNSHVGNAALNLPPPHHQSQSFRPPGRYEEQVQRVAAGLNSSQNVYGGSDGAHDTVGLPHPGDPSPYHLAGEHFEDTKHYDGHTAGQAHQ